jgi:hypothetical protein
LLAFDIGDRPHNSRVVGVKPVMPKTFQHSPGDVRTGRILHGVMVGKGHFFQ